MALNPAGGLRAMQSEALVILKRLVSPFISLHRELWSADNVLIYCSGEKMLELFSPIMKLSPSPVAETRRNLTRNYK